MAVLGGAITGAVVGLGFGLRTVAAIGVVAASAGLPGPWGPTERTGARGRYRLVMARATKLPPDPDDAPLKRLGGGRWQTRDGRFTIEPQSGTWVVVDGEQTDDLGLPLVRGPFPSLTSAKDAIANARSSAPAASPLTDRIEQRRREPAAEPAATPAAGSDRAGRAGPDRAGRAAPGRASAGQAPRARESGRPDGERSEPRGRPTRPADPAVREGEASREPGWLADLEPGERGRARRLIARLAEKGIADAEGLVRRDLAGGVPALAAHAIARRLAELGEGAGPDDVAELLAEGRDEGLGVRWRLVDGDGRPIVLPPAGRPRR